MYEEGNIIGRLKYHMYHVTKKTQKMLPVKSEGKFSVVGKESSLPTNKGMN